MQVLSSLCVLGREAWIDGDALRRFILCCQDTQEGGISDKPGTRCPSSILPNLLSSSKWALLAGDEADVFHTFFGIAGLSLLSSDGVLPIDPAHALPVHVMERIRSQQSQ